jgi:hypothetical protein
MEKELYFMQRCTPELLCGVSDIDIKKKSVNRWKPMSVDFDWEM